MAWAGEMRKGVVELCVLALLDGEPAYGYQIAQRLEQHPSLSMKESTLYLLLARLQKEGLVTVEMKASERGPKRRYFSLNADGRARLNGMTSFWNEMRGDVSAVFGGDGQ